MDEMSVLFLFSERLKVFFKWRLLVGWVMCFTGPFGRLQGFNHGELILY